MDFEKFCSDDNHENLARDCGHFHELFNQQDKSKKYLLALSGGIDSALLLSAAHKVIVINPFHLARPIYSDELDTAKSVSNFFNKKLKVINIYNKKYSPFDFNDDITYDLNFNYDFIKKDSVFFFLNNSDALIQRKFPNYKIFSGDGFPMSLTQDHFMVYPDRINREMGYGVHKDKRYPYSYSAFQGLLNKILL